MGGPPTTLIEPGHYPVVMMTPAAYGRFVQNYVSTFWPAYAGSRFLLHSVQSLARILVQQREISGLKKIIPDMLKVGEPIAESFKTAGPLGSPDYLRGMLEFWYEHIYDAWHTGVAHGVGGAWASAKEQMMGIGQLRYAYETLMYHTAITPKMRRYWNTVYTPLEPNASMGWSLYTRGDIPIGQFRTYAGYDGWSSENADLLMKAWTQYPTVRAAFDLLMRGKITTPSWKKYVRAAQWPTAWADKLYSLFERLPTPHEAFYLYRKDLINLANRNKLYKAGGFDSRWWNIIDANWRKLPTLAQAFDMRSRGLIGPNLWDHYLKSTGWAGWASAKLFDALQKLPTAKEAFWLHKKGLITLPVRDKLYTAAGYDKAWHSMITTNWENLPSAKEAFYLHRKNLIKLADRNKLYAADGYAPEWWPIITGNWEYVPTLYDLTRIADYIEVDVIWATKILKKRGLTDEDIAKIMEYLKLRPLREELRSITTELLYQRRMGYITPTLFSTEIEELGLRSTERGLLEDLGTLYYERELLEERIDVLKEYYKSGAITEDQLLQSFLDLGIMAEKANLMVEELKAMGYPGYY